MVQGQQDGPFLLTFQGHNLIKFVLRDILLNGGTFGQGLGFVNI